jgi:hypothetical protein
VVVWVGVLVLGVWWCDGYVGVCGCVWVCVGGGGWVVLCVWECDGSCFYCVWGVYGYV